MNKSYLRKFYKNKRYEMSVLQKKSFDEIIQKKFLKSEDYKKCQNILVYVSGKIEVDTHLIIDNALREKNVYCPKCQSVGISMDFFKIDHISQLKKGMYDIYEPMDNLPKWENSIQGANLCIVPALSYDKSGYRLGFGKGYYDRFLCDFDGIKIGLCYENCLCENLPSDNNDIRTDKLITEKNNYDFKQFP